MKLNRKGFMMAEVIIVSAIVLTFLAGIFISYNKIYSAYMKRLTYADTITLYRLGFYRDYYHDMINEQIQSNAASTLLDEITGTSYQEKVYLLRNGNTALADGVLGSSVNPTYTEYVKYLSGAVDLSDTTYVMLIERCKASNLDDCKYAYLEVSDET